VLVEPSTGTNLGTLGQYQTVSSAVAVFEPCAPGASGATSGQMQSIYSCNPQSSRFVIADNSSIYLLDLLPGASSFCFANYLFRAPYSNATVQYATYDMFHDRYYFVLNGSQIAYISSPCAQATLPSVQLLFPLSPVNTPPRQLFLMQGGDFICHSAGFDYEISCYPTSPSVQGVRFTKPIAPAIQIFGVGWDASRSRLWVVSANPTMRLMWFTFDPAAPGFVLDKETLVTYPTGQSALIGFSIITATGDTLWRFGPNNPYAVYEINLGAGTFAAISDSSIPSSYSSNSTWFEAMLSPPYWVPDPTPGPTNASPSPTNTMVVDPTIVVFNQTNSTSTPTPTPNANVTASPLPPSCGGFWSCLVRNPGEFTLLILLMAFPVVLCCALLFCFMRKRWKKRRTGQLLVGNGHQSHSAEDLDSLRHSKSLPCPSLRKFIRAICCFCGCCYDPTNGRLRCCFSWLGGVAQNRFGRYHAMQDFSIVDPADANGGGGGAAPPGADLRPPAQGDDALGVRPVFTAVSLGADPPSSAPAAAAPPPQQQLPVVFQQHAATYLSSAPPTSNPFGSAPPESLGIGGGAPPPPLQQQQQQ